MPNIYFFSGPCGCGKTTLANAYAKHLATECGKSQVYVIHGDDFHAGFVEQENRAANILAWSDILEFNWECILAVAQKALDRGFDVVIDYVIEDELPLVRELATHYDANLYYVVLTASQESIRQRITQRGDVELMERALFLKEKLYKLSENGCHLFDNTDKTVEQELAELQMDKFIV